MFARHLRTDMHEGETSGALGGTRERQFAAAAVAAQVALLTAQALLKRRHDWPTPASVKLLTGVVAVAGAAVMGAAGSSLGRGLTASPLPNPHAELRTDGPYRYVRHPIYTGVIAMSWARTAASGDRRQVALSVLLMGLFYGKSTLEEGALARRFSAYPSYAAGIPRFLPRLSRR
ncbi:MAG TPA: methyltransferase [Acidothermaceae bacterium]|nr:methyltransferase [Acidothermaceae bacterium]